MTLERVWRFILFCLNTTCVSWFNLNMTCVSWFNLKYGLRVVIFIYFK